MSIQELDRVALVKPIPEHGLEPGDVGTVVMVHQEGRGYTLEFMTLGGDTIAVVTVKGDAVRAVRPREISHVREVA